MDFFSLDPNNPMKAKTKTEKFAKFFLWNLSSNYALFYILDNFVKL